MCTECRMHSPMLQKSRPFVGCSIRPNLLLMRPCCWDNRTSLSLTGNKPTHNILGTSAANSVNATIIYKLKSINKAQPAGISTRVQVVKQSQRNLVIQVSPKLVPASTIACSASASLEQKRRATEALEARAPPPDGVATLVNSLQNRVKSYHSVRNFERKNGK